MNPNERNQRQKTNIRRQPAVNNNFKSKLSFSQRSDSYVRNKKGQQNCTARRCSPLRRKFMKCSINSPALSLLMKHLVIGQRLKTPNFLAFHWSPHGSLVSIGQNFVTTRVVHLPKRTETSLITESDQSGPNHQLLQLCTARTRLCGPCIAALAGCHQ